jgi:hypothetical protein
VSVGSPALETRSREILAEIIEEAMAERDGIKLPDPAALTAFDTAITEPAETSAAAEAEAAQPIDELATPDLVKIAQHGASLELDGSKYTSEELELIAEHVADEAHLKISNSGAFSARELAAIAQRGAGQVIFA